MPRASRRCASPAANRCFRPSSMCCCPPSCACRSPDVSLTTNGQLLTRKAATILNAGVRRINVSLDTLDPEAFPRIARTGDLATVLLGVEQMLAAGIRVKINMVPMRTKNADQVLPMLDYCFERGIELRFIELMNMGHLRSGNQYVAGFLWHGRDPRRHRHTVRIRPHRRAVRLHGSAIRSARQGRLRHHRQRKRTVLQFLHAIAPFIQRPPLRLPLQCQVPRHPRRPGSCHATRRCPAYGICWGWRWPTSRP